MSKKKRTAILATILWASMASAQYLPERGEWFHMSFSHLVLLEKPNELTNKWTSNGWQFMLTRETLFSRRSHWGIGYGLGVSTSAWYTNLNIKSSPNSTDFTYQYLPADSSYNSNKFSASYIDIPIEFRYRSKSNSYGQYFRFYFGGLIGYKFNSYSHFRNNDYSLKYYRINDMARWHYGVFVRTGFWLFNLYAYYGINGVFSDIKNGPAGLDKMRSLSLGLSISI